MTFASRKMTSDDLTHDGMLRIINRDIAELNHLSDKDWLALWSFFKALCSEPDEEGTTFLTMRDSIIWKHRDELLRMLESDRPFNIELIEDHARKP